MNKLTRSQLRELCATRIMQWIPAGDYWLERSGRLWYVEARKSGVKDEVCDLPVWDPMEYAGAFENVSDQVEKRGYSVTLIYKHWDTEEESEQPFPDRNEDVLASVTRSYGSEGVFRGPQYQSTPKGKRLATIYACLMALGVINEQGEINA